MKRVLSLLKEMKSMKRVLSIASAALALATLAGSAAANSHVYHGHYCKALFVSQAADLSTGTISGIFNAGNDRRHITCPVLVDEASTTTGTNAVKVHWVANAATDLIICTLFSMNGNGTIRESRSANKTGTGWFTIPNVTSDDPSGGSYLMRCDLPSRGTLNTILLDEK